MSSAEALREYVAWEPAQLVGAARASVSAARLLALVEEWERIGRAMDYADPNGSDQAEDVGLAAGYLECAVQIREVLFGAG